MRRSDGFPGRKGSYKATKATKANLPAIRQPEDKPRLWRLPIAKRMFRNRPIVLQTPGQCRLPSRQLKQYVVS